MTVEQAPTTGEAGDSVAMGSPRHTRGRASFLTVVRVVWKREMLIFFRDRPLIIAAFIMPLVVFVVLAEGLGDTLAILPGSIDYRQFFLPGMISYTVISQSVNTGVSIVTDRQMGFLREILVAPVSGVAICIGKIAGLATVAFVMGNGMLAVAPLLGVDLSFEVVAKLIGLIALMSFLFAACGVALGTWLRSVQGFQTITGILIYPALFLSGVFFPLNNVPIWLDVIAKFNPLTYAVAPIREVALAEHLKDVPADAPFQITHVEWFGYTLSTWEELGIVVILGTAMLIIAVRAIRTTE